MKQLTPTEWARARDRIVTLSMPDRGPIVHAEWTAWLAERPGPGWFYPMGDQIYFGAQADAEVFRHWIMAAV